MLLYLLRFRKVWRREWDSRPEIAIFPELILKQMRAVGIGFSVLPSLMAKGKC